MSAEIENAQELFEANVPYSDATFLVLKAHLVLEAALLKFIEARVTSDVYKELATSKNIDFATRVLFAKALAGHDEINSEDSEYLWRPLKALGNLRNHLAHNLTHSGTKIEDKMRNFIELVDQGKGMFPSKIGDDHLFRIFRLAASHLNSLLAISQKPISFSDIDLD